MDDSRIVVTRSGEDAMSRALQAGCFALLMVMLTATASAQEDASPWQHATTLNAFAGAATDFR